jgi:hypothetical protein
MWIFNANLATGNLMILIPYVMNPLLISSISSFCYPGISACVLAAKAQRYLSKNLLETMVVLKCANEQAG